MALGLLIVAVLAAVAYTQANQPPKLGDQQLGTIQDALKAVPGQDVGGSDLPDVARPAGSVRSYYLNNSALTTVIYSQHQDFAVVKADVEQKLAQAGWQPFDTRSPGPEVSASKIWQATYYKTNETLQINMLRTGDVTSTSLVEQKKPS